MSEQQTTPGAYATFAADVITHMLSTTPLSLIEIGAVLRMAATICDETASMHERALMIGKLRGWRPK